MCSTDKRTALHLLFRQNRMLKKRLFVHFMKYSYHVLAIFTVTIDFPSQARRQRWIVCLDLQPDRGGQRRKEPLPLTFSGHLCRFLWDAVQIVRRAVVRSAEASFSIFLETAKFPPFFVLCAHCSMPLCPLCYKHTRVHPFFLSVLHKFVFRKVVKLPH